jgi:hypothetical protein
MMADWQGIWPFDFKAEYDSRTKADGAAMKANCFFWWLEQNIARHQWSNRVS